MDISTVRFEEMSLNNKGREEKRPTYMEVEGIRIKTVDGTADSVPVQPEPAGTEHLSKKMFLKKLQRIQRFNQKILFKLKQFKMINTSSG